MLSMNQRWTLKLRNKDSLSNNKVVIFTCGLCKKITNGRARVISNIEYNACW